MSSLIASGRLYLVYFFLGIKLPLEASGEKYFQIGAALLAQHQLLVPVQLLPLRLSNYLRIKELETVILRSPPFIFMLSTLLNEKLPPWIAKNKALFIIIILIAGNVYQYLDRKSIEEVRDKTISQLNVKVDDMNNKSIQYERDRAEKLQFLLDNLSRLKQDGNH